MALRTLLHATLYASGVCSLEVLDRFGYAVVGGYLRVRFGKAFLKSLWG